MSNTCTILHVSSPGAPRRRLRAWATSLILLGLASCIGPESALAQPKIQVLMKNGDQWERALPDIRRITFQNPNLVFSLVGGSTHQIVHADIRRITFDVPISTQAAERPAKTGTAAPFALEASTTSYGAIALSLALPAAAALRLEMLSLDGTRIRTLADGDFRSGPHAFAWDGHDDHGRLVDPGTFLVVATAAGKVLTRKILWLRRAEP